MALSTFFLSLPYICANFYGISNLVTCDPYQVLFFILNGNEWSLTSTVFHTHAQIFYYPLLLYK